MHFFHRLVYLYFIGVSLVCGSISDFSPVGSSLSGGISEDDSLVLEVIPGTRDYRINSKKDQYEKPWFDGRDLRFIHCVRPAKCEKLRNNTCFGTKLPYSSTSLDLTDSFSQEESREKLYNYEALRNIPKCWAVIQPFLCAVFAPKCERIKNRDMVYLPSLEMCRITAEPCGILYNTSFFPEFLKCNETFFPSKCNNDVRDMKFNAVGQCLAPLVQAESSTSYYKDIEGCGVQCKDPLYTDDEHEDIHKLIGWGVTICAICNVFVIATYSIHDWKKSKYPAWIIFYINICILINWIGWVMQFIPGNRENIVCRKDGTLRHSEPSAGENLSCIIPFILIYYFLAAAMVWFAIFSYAAWYLQTTDRGSIRDRIDKKTSYFHLIAWSLPLVLTITIMALSEVDGNSIVGICFVGYRNHAIRSALVLGPVGVLVFISSFFIFRGMVQINSIKRNSAMEYSNKTSSKLQSIILHLIIRSMVAMLCIVFSFVFQFYEFKNSQDWALSLDQFILCKIKSAYSDTPTICKLESRPSVAILQLRLLAVFGTSIALSSWCWTKSTLNTWNRYIKRKLGQEISDGENFTKPKHKVIADAYAKRKEGVISVSIQNTHTDPAGVNFDMNNLNLQNSTESNGMGATLTNYLYHLLKRRNALTSSIPKLYPNNCAPFASSCDSEISVSVRQITLESRRSSIDSQVSVKMSETEIKATMESRSHHRPKGLKMKTKNRQRTCYASTRKSNRRASSSSVESQMITTALKKIKCKYPNNKIRFQSNSTGGSVVKNRRTDRRSACTTLDIHDINKLLNRANPGHDGSSDDDNLSLTSVKFKNAQSNIIMKGFNQDDSMDSSEMVSEVHMEEQHFKMENRRLHYPNIHEILQTARSFGEATRGARLSEVVGTKNSRNSLKSSKSKQASRPMDILSSSLSTSSELEIPLGATHSSFSGNSLGNKTHSRNSKASCDVGIQANAFDITSQTMAFDEEVGHLKAIGNGQDLEEDEEFTENHKLISFKKRDASIVARKDINGISDTEKLKNLLMPTK